MGGITAIVPTYNRAHLLRECVASLLAQTRPMAEILVIDDGSHRDATTALNGLKGPIRVLRQPNRGKAAALNLGLSEAREDYIWICDDDDLALQDAAARLGAALDGCPEAGFAYGGYLRFRDDPATHERKVCGPGYWPSDAEQEELFATLLDDFFVFQFATLVRRSAYAEVGPFREDLVRSQDYEMILRLARAFAARRVEGPIFLQREHDATRGSQADAFSAARMFDKWNEYGQRLFTQLHRELPLTDFTPEALKGAGPSLQLRAAHLKRGCVLARHKLWPLALGDFEQACSLWSAGAPTAPERAIASRILGGKFGCLEVVEDRELLQALTQVFRQRPYGRALRAQVARPLRWRARQALLNARGGEAIEYLCALVRFMGAARGAAWMASGVALKLLQAGTEPAGIRRHHLAGGQARLVRGSVGRGPAGGLLRPASETGGSERQLVN